MVHSLAWVVLVALVTVRGSEATTTNQGKASSHSQYCIVGAGPGGLQLGHFMKHAGRNYVIFEKADRAGYFFEVYPRHRELISLNKRFVRKERGADFAFRHDWNSLIDLRDEEAKTPPMTTRTKAMWPHADVLAGYLQEFAEEQKDHIEYRTAVSKIKRSTNDGSAGFEVSTIREAPNGTTTESLHHCDLVVVSTGLWTPRDAKISVDGDAYLEHYEDMPETGEAYDGDSIVVLGLGNAALETAKAFQPHAADVTIYGRYRDLPEGGKGVRFAWQTHYVGDIRAGRTNILDNYFLKSLDGLEFETLTPPSRLGVLPCLNNQRCLFPLSRQDCVDNKCKKEHNRGGQNLDYMVQLLDYREGTAVETYIRKALEKHAILKPNADKLHWHNKYQGVDISTNQGSEIDTGDESDNEKAKAALLNAGVDLDVFSGMDANIVVSTKVLRENKALMDIFAALRSRFGDSNNRYPVHHVVRAFGWVMDKSIFDSSIPLETTHHGKYPSITPMYEAKGVPGLYFAGTLCHGLDFRHSSGGFIHGFRYTARTLFNSLEEKNFGIQWPSTTIDLESGVDSVRNLTSQLLERINDASGPYQMFESLIDGVVFSKNAGGGWMAKYIFEMPIEEFHERYFDSPRIWWVFRYRPDFYGPMVLGKHRVGSYEALTSFNSTFLHPKLSFCDGGVAAKDATVHHFLTEDVFTIFENHGHTIPLRRWVAKVLQKVTGWSFEDEASKKAIDEDINDVDEVLKRLLADSGACSSDSPGGECSSITV
eukprot:gnl/MRDRNA2_/MRDRNA2_84707_c0_seq1.p1 gnl/MRDRNA2_/MRDRNA2_84707_c0~~gnl/MRDRNA2_/MRDRNA2_84707_c0_seq1.p1  ORF type:complete len:765 (+),score=135.09 gnl/MRDRNA2_/MRDRNA2_84707_c0_seq1:161-2455(+)